MDSKIAVTLEFYMALFMFSSEAALDTKTKMLLVKNECLHEIFFKCIKAIKWYLCHATNKIRI